jgi:hypothetical protein
MATRESIGIYEGEIAPVLTHEAGRAWLAGLGAAAASAARRRGQGGAFLFEAEAPTAEGPRLVMVKGYGQQRWIKNVGDRRRGTAAERAWRAALHLQAAGVGTPQPLAWLERWQGGRLAEAYFVARCIEGISNGRDELRHLLRYEAFTDRLFPFLETLAAAIRSLHDAGVIHGDLGNQNILMRRAGDARWTDVQFIDLNRARVLDRPLSERERALDLSRIYLPSDLLRCFFQMYFRGRAPEAFLAEEQKLRARFAWHSRSRIWRHPIRQRRLRRAMDPLKKYPLPPEVWIWDEKSAQPINAETSRVRNRYHPRRSVFLLLRAALPKLPAVGQAYRSLHAGAYGAPVDLAGRVALAVEPRPATWDLERAWLQKAGPVPVLIRCYRHKGTRQWDFVVRAVRELAAAGHRVAVALVQDRRSVLEPAAWAAMAERVVPQINGVAEWIEVGHAINRVKWGLWDLADYRKLVEPLAELRAAYPSLRLMGPAGIDFEYLHVLGALKVLPRDFRFDALSHHLYVDRRGAPEARQGRFAALEKFALARALARTSDHCADRLIVSEVNWPILGTHEWSPVGSPYTHPGQVLGPPNVTAEAYAHYMVRYLVQAACSGLVERVYWWRLAAHGFGLVDERADPWQPRPAWFALLHLLRTVGEATFERNLPAPERSHLHLFRRADGERVVMGYTWADAPVAPAGFVFTSVETCDGSPASSAHLSGAPLYFRRVTL